jgi:hypothetical protein
MAKATVGAAGIETISGALKRPKKQNGHNHGNYLVMTHRKAASTDPNCQRIYSFAADRYDRSTPLTPEETAVRSKFTAVSRATSTRLKDPSQMAQDQAAFKAQTRYKTLRQYVWAAEAAKWEQNNG